MVSALLFVIVQLTSSFLTLNSDNIISEQKSTVGVTGLVGVEVGMGVLEGVLEGVILGVKVGEGVRDEVLVGVNVGVEVEVWEGALVEFKAPVGVKSGREVLVASLAWVESAAGVIDAWLVAVALSSLAPVG